MSETSPLFVASDVHGHFDALVEALRGRGLVDGDAAWTGGDARLWILGDLFDRGEEGVAVVRLLRRLAGQAAAEGGIVDTLVGNHEVLMLGSKRFGDRRFTDVDGQERQFLHWWVLNGGFEDDLGELTDDEAEWLRTRRVVHLVGRSLLVHSDTESYLAYGRSEEAVNTAVRAVMASDEPEEWWQLFRELTRRHEFMGADGPSRARGMLRAFGGEELIHGHSTIPDTTDLEPGQVTQARRYCDGLALNVDGGVYQGGRCLVVHLNLFTASLSRKRKGCGDRWGSGALRGSGLHPQAQREGRSDAEDDPSGERGEGDEVAQHCGRRRGERRSCEGVAERMPSPPQRPNFVVSHIRHNDAGA
ncbi:metallophosphoesterase [Glycomyces sp. L485]|uniref:metallophosphoesterase n=1 Tax=Glycomyces sp. L485 TaxID=2909235 RepID=UPI001F4B6ABF|nr:metallophosphoesterase [Glycomyces sp. L485]MCH7230963.1 metallophosphoesterase [Glycomyces sp. L485]